MRMHRISEYGATRSLVLLAALLLAGCSKIPFRNKDFYLARAQRYMSRHEMGDAAIEYRKALQKDPSFVPALAGLAQADLALKEWAGAYNALTAAVNLAPERLDLHLELGRLYLATRDDANAENEARFVLKRQADNTVALQLLAASLVAEKKNSAAEAIFKQIAGLRPTDASAEVNLAVVQIGQHQFADAERSLQAAIMRDQHDVEAFVDLAKLYHLEQQPDRELASYQAAAKQNPTSSQIRLAWAEALYRDGQPTAGAAALAQVEHDFGADPEIALAIGEWHQQWNELQPAITAYQAGLAAAPNNLELEYHLVATYLAAGNTTAAQALNRDILRRAPDDVGARIEDARIQLAAGNSTAAIDELRGVLDAAPDSSEAHAALGEAYNQAGDMQLARTELQKALSEKPDSLPALRALARLGLEHGDVQSALYYAHRAVSVEPQSVENILALGSADLAARQFAEAKAEFLRARTLAPTAAPAYLRLGDFEVATHNSTAAANDYEMALRLDPRDDDALARLADLFLARHQPQLAVARVQQYLAANPKDSDAHEILGAVFLAGKQYAQAKAELAQSVALNPHFVLAFLQLGRAYQAEGHADRALETYQQALALKPNFAPLATLIGTLYLQRKDLDRARTFFQQALAADPNFAVAAGNLAWVDLLQDKDLQQALGLAEKAKQLMPNVDSISDTLALAYYKNGAYSSALPLLRACISHQPKEAQYRYHMGLVLAARGDKTAAREQLTAALRMNLQGGDAQHAQALVSQIH